MPNLQLTFASALYDRMQPIYTSEVKPDGIDLNFIRIEQPRPIFDRMSGGEEFDVAEYSSSEYVQRYANKKCPFVAIPVFPSRCFRHAFIGINKKKGIAKPKDLEGKRIGVALYTMTAAIFIRGLLQHDFGVDLADVRWVEGALNEAKPHGHPTKLKLSRPVSIEANTSGQSLSDLIATGEISATIAPGLPKSANRDPNVGRLFPDYLAREKDYYRRTRIFPIMHTVVVRRDVYRANPWIAVSLTKAFAEAKRRVYDNLITTSALTTMLPWQIAHVEDARRELGEDWWPYGFASNRDVLDTFLRYHYEQGLSKRRLQPEELFAPETLEAFKI